MAPTTDIGIRQFYDHLAGNYDRMTGLEKRFAAERPAFRALVDSYGIRSAVDAGAGTGFHTLLLSELGVAVTAVDLSSAMLEALRANARERHVEARTIQSSFEDLSSRLTGAYDAVFCMGNSLPHLLTEGELSASLKSFLLAERERVLSAKEEGEKIFVRFYDFLEERIGFNLLTITCTPSGLKTECKTVPLRPWQGEELKRQFAEAGFSAVRFFGNVAMNPYDPATSRDLVILAQD